MASTYYSLVDAYASQIWASARHSDELKANLVLSRFVRNSTFRPLRIVQPTVGRPGERTEFGHPATPTHPMLPASAISLSGMNAAQTALGVSAHNIANLATSGFRRQEVVQSTAVNGGVATSLTQASEAGSAIETDFVGQLMAKNAFLANWAVFRTSNKMLGALLNEKG
ncbi:MAG: flagellar basal body protein [Burkholderiaceae bacterium]|nr:flagellar basal body protein [Burkholderiaceae bacterium]